MDALNNLEKRIDFLSRIIGTTPDTNEILAKTSDDGVKTSPSATENIVDTLIAANNIINESISDHPSIKGILQRSDEIEKYLEPNFLEDSQQTATKEVYLNAIAPDLYEQFSQLQQIKQLEPTLGAEYFRNIPGECLDKLKQMNQVNVDLSQEAELIEVSLILAMKRYGEIQAGLLESLDAMNKRLDFIEAKLNQKRINDMEKELTSPVAETK